MLILTNLNFLMAKGIARSLCLLLVFALGLASPALVTAKLQITDKTANAFLQKDTTQLNIATQLEHFEDPNSLYTLEEIRSSYDTLKWSFSPDDVPNFGFTQSTIWLHTKLTNQGSANEDWVIEGPYSQINELDIYLFYEDGRSFTFEHGINRLRLKTFPPHRHILVPFELKEGEGVDIYLRYKNDLSSQVPLFVWAEDNFFYADEAMLASQVVFFGIMFAMTIYNFVLFLFVRDESYGYYVCFVISITIFQAFQQGFTYQYFTHLSENAYLTATTLSIICSVFFANVFFDKFLNLSVNHPPSHQYLAWVRGACLLSVVSIFFLNNFYALQVSIFLAIPGVFGVIALSVIALIKRVKAARYFVAAWSVFLAGVVLLLLNKLGIIPRNFITENSLQIGSAFEVLLLSIALADRINIDRQEKIVAQERALKNEKIARETQERAKAELEHRVNERTQELSQAMERLEIANQSLKEISNIDGLTGVKNRRYFNERLREEWNRALRGNIEVSLLLIDLDHFKKLNDNYGHLFGDECLIAAAMVIRSHARREEDLAARYGGEEFAVILPNCPQKDAIVFAESIRRDIEALEIKHGEESVLISASIGVATLVPNKKEFSPDQLISAADIALYNAKRDGRNRVSEYNT